MPENWEVTDRDFLHERAAASVNPPDAIAGHAIPLDEFSWRLKDSSEKRIFETLLTFSTNLIRM